MNLTAFDLPEQPSDVAGWLERQLVGADLALIAAELLAVHGDAPLDAGAFDRVLPGPALDRVLTDGLSAVHVDTLRHLLRQPRLLLELQARVLERGGAYWDAVERPPPLRDRLERARAALLAFLQDPASGRTMRLAPIQERRVKVVWYRRPWVVSLATAAAMVVIGLVLRDVGWPQRPVDNQAWGWNRPGVIDEKTTASSYLEHLASAAGEWSAAEPKDAAQLAERLIALRQGCSRLILARHPALSPDDRTWLVGRCQAWATKIDQHLAAIEKGQDLASVRAEADETVKKLVAALKERAGQT